MVGSLLAGGREGKTEILTKMEVTMPGTDGLRSRIFRSVKMLLLPLALLTAHPCLCEGTDDQALVDQFFPQRLVDDFAAMWPDETPSKQSAFVAADLNGSGLPEFLIALYSTNVSAAVRVLKKQGGSAVLVNEPNCVISADSIPGFPRSIWITAAVHSSWSNCPRANMGNRGS
ncbi:MAG: hypothetical protein ABSD56_13980 [Bryobacteraceae bacterium]